MIRTVPELRAIAADVIKIAQVTDPSKTEGKRLFALVTDILDTVDDLVLQQGLSISNTIQAQRIEILQMISDNIAGINTSLQTYANTHMPDLSLYALASQLPNLSTYQLKTDAIAYSRLTGLPNFFSGSYADLTGKPAQFSGSYLDLTNKPSIFSGSYLDLTNKPVIFDGNYNNLSNRPVLFSGNYLDLSNKPTIITDYTQLTSKPSMSRLLWNQLSPTPVTNTTSEVNTLITGNGTLNIDANPIVGTTFRVTGRGLFSLQTITSPSLTVKLYLGNVVIATGTSSSLLLGASNKSFSFGADILITGINSVYSQGFFSYYAGLTDALSSTPLINSSGGALNSTVDLSVSTQLKLTFTWSIANAANLITVKVVNFEKLNN